MQRHQSGEALDIHIPTSDDDADALSLQQRSGSFGPGKTKASRWLDENLHARCKEPHAVNQFFVTYSQNAVYVTLYDFEIQASDMLCLCAIRNGFRYGNVYN